MKKIKVMHILPDFGVAGAEKLVSELLLNYNKETLEVSAVSLFNSKESYLVKELEESKCKLFFLNKKSGIDFNVIKDLYILLKKEKPDIIHTHRYVVPYVLFPAILANVLIRVHTVHNIASKELTSKGIIIQNIAYKLFNFKPVAISTKIAKTIEETYGIKDTIVIYNGIDTKKFLDLEKKMKDNKKIKLLHIGRFAEQKNHKLLIDAFKEISLKNNNIELSLVGDGETKKEVENRVKEYKLDDKVKFLGIRKDIPRLMKENDIFVLPSLWEGLPITLLEAMAAGLPIICTDVGGNSDIIDNMNNGILIESNNKEELVNAIELLIYDKELRGKLSERSVSTAKKYDINEISSSYENIYISLLKKDK